MKQDSAWSLARPSESQLAWQDMEMGMFIHWFPMYEPEFKYKNPQYSAMLEDVNLQKELAQSFDIEPDVEQWAQAAVDMGAKYVVFVAKHFFGFCRWNTETTEFSMKNSKWKDGKGDVVDALYHACKKRGLKMGVYVCGDSLTFGAGSKGITKDPAKQENYNKVYRAWLTELLSRYPDLCEVWFDGSISVPVRDILQKYAPNAMVFQSPYATIRWVGQEEGYANDPAWNSVSRFDARTGIATQKHGNPDGEVWMPLECDARIRYEWGYHNDPSNYLRSLDELLEMYYKSVGRGAVLLLNHAPSTRGIIDEEDLARGKELGDAIRSRFANPLMDVSGVGNEVVYEFDAPTVIDHVVTMEDIRFGERIRAYRIEGKTAEGWKLLAAGSALGHKKIDFFEEQEVTAVKIKVVNSVGEPQIRSMKAYHVGILPHFAEHIEADTHMVGTFNWAMWDYTNPENKEVEFSYPIGSYIDAAGEYQITFKKDVEGDFATEEANLVIEGVSRKDYITKDSDTAYSIYLGGISGDITFSVKATGGIAAGKVYLKRVR